MRIAGNPACRVVPASQVLFTSWSSSISAFPFNASVAGLGTQVSGDAYAARDLSVRTGNTDVLWSGTTTSNGDYFRAQPWSFTTGFGTKYAVAGYATTGASYACAFSADGNYAVIGGTNSPRAAVFPFTSGTGFGTKVADPATALPAGIVWSLSWRSSSQIVIGSAASPYLAIYRFTSGAWSTKYADITSPAGAAVGGTVNDAEFASDNFAVAAAHAVSPYLHTYDFSSTAGFLTWYTPIPGTWIGATGQSVSWTPAGDVLAVGAGDTFNVYKWDGDYTSKYTNPTGDGTGLDTQLVEFNKDGDYFAAGGWSNTGGAGTGFIAAIWPFNRSSGFGTKYSELTITGNVSLRVMTWSK